MFLRASGLLYERLYLLTLGATCRYVICAEDGSMALTDPGASIHVDAIETRLERLGLHLSSLRHVFLTHLDADRIAAIPLLRRKLPSLRVYGTATMRRALQDEKFVRSLWEQDQKLSDSLLPSGQKAPSLSLEEFASGLHLDKHLAETDSVELDEDITIRSVSTPGHRPHSVSYIVVPHEFLIADETFGYFRGRSFAAPGGDYDINVALASIEKFHDLELSGLGLSYGGCLTGSLAKRHIAAIKENTSDLIAAVAKARNDGFSESEIEEQVRAAFYTTDISDPCLTESLRHTFQAVMRQLRPLDRS